MLKDEIAGIILEQTTRDSGFCAENVATQILDLIRERLPKEKDFER